MRNLRRALIALMLTALTFAGLQAPAQAQTAADRTIPVYFVHGLKPGLVVPLTGPTDCRQWDQMITMMMSHNWNGPAHKVAYYSDAVNCNTRVFNGTDSSNLNEIAKALAWDIRNRYTSRGQPVRVVAHSMGGLVIRRALTASHHGEAGWPKINVRDVITVATPHRGSNAAQSCSAFNRQCQQILPNSGFINFLVNYGWHPQGTQGTRWSLYAAANDPVVARVSAWGMGGPAPYKLAYNNDYDHSSMLSDRRISPTISCDVKDRGTSVIEQRGCYRATERIARQLTGKIDELHSS